jgi:hypothetical protein
MEKINYKTKAAGKKQVLIPFPFSPPPLSMLLIER